MNDDLSFGEWLKRRRQQLDLHRVSHHLFRVPIQSFLHSGARHREQQFAAFITAGGGRKRRRARRLAGQAGKVGFFARRAGAPRLRAAPARRDLPASVARRSIRPRAGCGWLEKLSSLPY